MSLRECAFEEIVDFYDHMRVPVSTLERDKRQGEYPYYGAQNIIDHIDDYIFDGEFVLIAEDGANLVTRNEPIAQIARGKFWVNNHAHIVKARENISTNYFINTLINSMNLTGYVTGAAQPKFSQKNLAGVKVKIPPYTIQVRISEILSAYDDLIANNRRRIQLLEQAARHIYKEWFVSLCFPGHERTRVVAGVPVGWEKGTIADFFLTGSGGTPTRKNPAFFEGTINWVKTQELLGGFIFSTDEKITEEAVANSAARILPPETVLLAMYGATIGQTAILAVPAAVNQACCTLQVNDARANYVYAYLFLRENKITLQGLSQGAAQKNVNQQVIKQFSMTMPTKELMDDFLSITQPLLEQIKTLQMISSRLQQARDLLLPRLMSGDISL